MEPEEPQTIGTALSLNTATSSPVQVSLYDLSGKRLMQTQMQHGISTKELGKFIPKGVYILKIKDNSSQKILRLNIQ